MVYVEVPDLGLLTLREVGDRPVEVGRRLGLRPREDEPHRFDAAGRALA